MNSEQAGTEGSVPMELLVDDGWGREPAGHGLLAEDTRCTTARILLNIEEPAFSRQGKSNTSTHLAALR